jgi:acetyl esterase/lipase
MKRIRSSLLALLLLAGCNRDKTPAPAPAEPGEPERKVSLLEARRGFETKLLRRVSEKEPVPEPPADLFRVVRYDSPAGKLAAYLSVDPKDGKKHPAIIWIFGGFGNGIGDTAWKEQPAKNDQSASAFRKAGLVMMYPALRGGNDNPGVYEGFYGEVDDVLAAADFLAKQPFVDPTRIYLGGHSTGGTLVLLVAAATDRFRAVFSFGPVSDVGGYGPDNLPFNVSDPRERELRSPARWLPSIRCPVFVFEGLEGNLGELLSMARISSNPLLKFYAVKGAGHFNILLPMTRLIAGKVVRDEGAKTNVSFTQEEVNGVMGK